MIVTIKVELVCTRCKREVVVEQSVAIEYIGHVYKHGADVSVGIDNDVYLAGWKLPRECELLCPDCVNSSVVSKGE